MALTSSAIETDVVLTLCVTDIKTAESFPEGTKVYIQWKSANHQEARTPPNPLSTRHFTPISQKFRGILQKASSFLRITPSDDAEDFSTNISLHFQDTDKVIAFGSLHLVKAAQLILAERNQTKNEISLVLSGGVVTLTMNGKVECFDNNEKLDLDAGDEMKSTNGKRRRSFMLASSKVAHPRSIMRRIKSEKSFLNNIKRNVWKMARESDSVDLEIRNLDLDEASCSDVPVKSAKPVVLNSESDSGISKATQIADILRQNITAEHRNGHKHKDDGNEESIKAEKIQQKVIRTLGNMQTDYKRLESKLDKPITPSNTGEWTGSERVIPTLGNMDNTSNNKHIVERFKINLTGYENDKSMVVRRASEEPGNFGHLPKNTDESKHLTDASESHYFAPPSLTCTNKQNESSLQCSKLKRKRKLYDRSIKTVDSSEGSPRIKTIRLASDAENMVSENENRTRTKLSSMKEDIQHNVQRMEEEATKLLQDVQDNNLSNEGKQTLLHQTQERIEQKVIAFLRRRSMEEKDEIRNGLEAQLESFRVNMQMKMAEEIGQTIQNMERLHLNSKSDMEQAECDYMEAQLEAFKVYLDDLRDLLKWHDDGKDLTKYKSSVVNNSFEKGSLPASTLRELESITEVMLARSIKHADLRKKVKTTNRNICTILKQVKIDNGTDYEDDENDPQKDTVTAKHKTVKAPDSNKLLNANHAAEESREVGEIISPISERNTVLEGMLKLISGDDIIEGSLVEQQIRKKERVQLEMETAITEKEKEIEDLRCRIRFTKNMDIKQGDYSSLLEPAVDGVSSREDYPMQQSMGIICSRDNQAFRTRRAQNDLYIGIETSSSEVQEQLDEVKTTITENENKMKKYELLNDVINTRTRQLDIIQTHNKNDDT